MEAIKETPKQETTEPVILETVTDASEKEATQAETTSDWQELLQIAEEPAAESNDPVVRLVQEYKEAIKTRDDWEDKYLRAAAEFANAKRRADLRADSQIWAARERLLMSILPTLDDFERAFRAVPAEERQSAWSEGFALIHRKLSSALEREGVAEIAADGQHFDPNLHQAVMSEAADDVEAGTVLEVLQKGYLLDGRVLRPSMVKVAQ